MKLDALSILLVDDEKFILSSLKRTLEELINADIVTANSPNEALKLCQTSTFDIVISDLSMPGMNGIELLTQIADIAPETIRIMLTAHSDVDYVLEAINTAKVWGYLQKPWNDKGLAMVIDQAIEMRSLLVERSVLKMSLAAAKAKTKTAFEGFIGDSPALQHVYSMIEKAAPSNASIFITGESGTGKEVAAQAIHNLSKRKLDKFVALNCAAIPSELMESEIFGHIKGAFSGAVSNREGAASQAHNGTLFLDELGEMDMSLQAKILRFVQTGTFQKVGSDKVEKVNVRFIAATNRDPFEAIKNQQLREDLYYRLNVISVHLPPLRARNDDVILLANHFMRHFMLEEQKTFTGFSSDAKMVLKSFAWPGNVRQLQNLLHSVVIMNDGPLINAKMLTAQLPVIQEKITSLTPTNTALPTPDLPEDVEPVAVSADTAIEPLADIERKAIQSAIAYYEDNVVKAASALGVSPSTLYRKIQQW